MDSQTGDLDKGQEVGNTSDAAVPASPVDGVQQTETARVRPDPVGADLASVTGGRQRGRRPLLFVLVLTGAVMVFAILVAVWLYWLAPVLAV